MKLPCFQTLCGSRNRGSRNRGSRNRVWRNGRLETAVSGNGLGLRQVVETRRWNPLRYRLLDPFGLRPFLDAEELVSIGDVDSAIGCDRGGVDC